MEPDFSGFATKAGLKCSDGRTISPEAFAHMDGMRVPLVWMHGHQSADNVMGHAILEKKDGDVYCKGFFNDTPQGKNGRELVQHGDIDKLSIWANELVEKSKNVLHGKIREVSLVLAGANPGALIDYVRVAHGDGSFDDLADEAIIHTGLDLEVPGGVKPKTDPKPEVKPDDKVEHAAGKERTGQEILDGLDADERKVVDYMLEQALLRDPATLEQSATGGSSTDDSTLEHKDKDKDMRHNAFEAQATTTNTDKGGEMKHSLTKDQIKTIMTTAESRGSLKEAILAHADEYGIGNIELLFPDAKTIDSAPELISRRMEWVAKVIDGARKTPFANIKSLSADITFDEARAKGYIKGNKKKDEFFRLAKRETTPYTIYKKQKLDRDDIIDITDLDIVAWLKGEMRIMLEEELARAILVGDGREPDDEDKINEEKIRPIAHDDDFYAHKVVIPANVSGDGFIEAILRARPVYKGRGNPTLFTKQSFLTDLLLLKDLQNRRLYRNKAELAAELEVNDIVTVDVMEDQSTDGGDLLAVMVNMSDYTIGANRGGQVTMFEDFDIDFNQQKYLMETRVSGALTRHKTALVFSRANGTQVTPVVPEFNPATGVVVIPSTTGVTYRNKATNAVLTAGNQTALEPNASVEVLATPNTGYYFPHNIDADNTFKRNA